MDEEATEPFVDPEDSKARINHIQCKDAVPCSEDTEEVAVYEEMMVIGEAGYHH